MHRLIAAIVFLCAVYALGQQASQPNRGKRIAGAKEQRSQDKTESNCQPIPAITEIPASASTKTTASESNKSQPEQHSDNSPKITDWLMVMLTLAYVVVSTFLLFAVKRQAEISKTQADIAREAADAAKQAAEAASGSLETSKKAIEIAEAGAKASAEIASSHASIAERHAKTVMTAERPWVIAVVERDAHRPGDYIFWLVNEGRTPARIVSVRTYNDVGRADVRAPTKPTEPPSSDFSDFGIVPPRGTMDQKVLLDILKVDRFSDEDIRGIQFETRRLVRFVEIVYTNTLDEQAFHETKMAFILSYHRSEFIRYPINGYTKHT